MFEIIKNLFNKQIGFPFDINQTAIDPDKSIEVQVQESFDALLKFYANDPEIYEHIDKNYQQIQIVLKLAPQFNYEDVQANGYWSYVLIILKISKILISPDLEKKVGRQAIINLFQISYEGLKICQQINDVKNKDDESKLGLFTGNLDFVMLWELVESLEPQLNSLHEFFNFCWLGSMSLVMQLFTNFLAVYSAHWNSFTFHNFLSRSERAKMFTNMVLNVNVYCLKSMWNITDFPLVRICTPSFWFRFSIRTENVYVSRQKRWLIDATRPMVHDLQKEKNVEYPEMQQRTVRCLLFRSREDTEDENKSLVFHIHGGGFISQSPESHAVYLTHWVKKLKNIPILSIDYTKSPEAYFPEALQEILDVYLWLISGSAEVKSELGFCPTKIVFCGDSAGGNFSMSMMQILNLIQKQVQNYGNENMDNYRYPDGLFLFYAPLILKTMVSPSRILTSVDGLVPLGTLLNCLSAYLPPEICEDRPKIRPKDKTETVLYQFGGNYLYRFTEILKYLLSLQLVNRSKPWHKRGGDLRKCSERMNKFLSNPLLSPLLLEKIEFNHIPLFLYPLTYDSFLDDSIELAKRWQKNKVKLHVIPDVPHGFLNLIDFNAEAKQASLHCLSYMSDILK